MRNTSSEYLVVSIKHIFCGVVVDKLANKLFKKAWFYTHNPQTIFFVAHFKFLYTFLCARFKQLVRNFFAQISSVNSVFCTLSTWPITNTIYIYYKNYNFIAFQKHIVGKFMNLFRIYEADTSSLQNKAQNLLSNISLNSQANQRFYNYKKGL